LWYGKGGATGGSGLLHQHHPIHLRTDPLPRHRDFPELVLMPPARCAEVYYSGGADIALVPVGAIRDYGSEVVCCNWCLGANGAVETVLLLSNTPAEELHTIVLDPESRTSNLLVQVLAWQHWKIRPSFVPGEPGRIHQPAAGEGVVLIGDKTFGIKTHYRYAYDLSAEWHRLTGLPFVFACWLSNSQVSEEVRQSFDQALQWGINHIQEAISTLSTGTLPPETVYDYLTRSISYRFDEKKQEAIRVFNSLCKSLPPQT
jgi:chorismate dehydratase